jgi:hypothetical protein
MGRHDGVPALDLLQVLAFLGFALDGTMGSHRFAESYRRAESGPLGGVRRACVARYAAAVGIDEETVRAIRTFTWMTLAEEQAVLRAAAGRPLQASDVARTFAALWEFEAERALSGRSP